MPFLWAKQMVEIQTAHQTSMALGMADHTSLGKPPQSTESNRIAGETAVVAVAVHPRWGVSETRVYSQ